MIELDSWTRLRITGLGFAAVLACAPGFASAQRDADAAQAMSAETAIKKWPKKLRNEAKILIERYGQPSSADENQLVWVDNAPWRKTILRREGFTRPMMGGTKDHLEQVISREVPVDKIAEIEKFDKRIVVNRAAGEVSSHSDSERMNFLALNLADEIVKGQRSVLDARAFALKVRSLEKAGKTSPYFEGLMSAAPAAAPSEPAAKEPAPSEPAPMSPEKPESTPPVYDTPNR
ncbi:MAG: hypothetical protein HYV14_11880 [Elusimicrobia bacterium]|nr:hypothetical protein [Elusimicrobiota bacterium]